MLCLMVRGLCDAFDGKLARKYDYSKEQKIYGMELDSLSDSFCFGAFPAVFTCAFVHHKVVYALAALYL